MQLLVENTIMHSIDHIETGQIGVLGIICHIDEAQIYFHVKDNGPGIPKEQLDTLLTSASGGYGIQNVHHRVQLFYGNSYGLSYRSTIGEGTKVILIIPQEIGWKKECMF